MSDPASTSEPLRCPECRYDLSGLPTGNCPECGRAFTPEQVREYWKSKESQPWFRLELALTLVSAAYVLLCNCTRTHPGGVPNQYLIVFAGGLAALLLSIPRMHKGTYPVGVAIFHIVPSTLTSLIVICSSRGPEDTLIVIAAGLVLASIIVVSFCRTARRVEAKLAYAFALFPTLLIVMHAVVRYLQGNAWTEFNWSAPPQMVSKGSELFIISTVFLGVQLILIALLEIAMHFSAPKAVQLTSSSPHSPAAAPAPPSQGEP